MIIIIISMIKCLAAVSSRKLVRLVTLETTKIAFTLEGIKFNLNSFRRNKFFPNLFSKQLFPLEVLSIFEPAIHLVCSINLNK